MQRRNFLFQMASALLLGACGGAVGPNKPSTLPVARARKRELRARPKKFVQLYFGGGMDSLYSFDPKTAGDVDSRVKIPYTPRDIVESHGLRFAPSSAHLAPYAQRMAVINGVVGGTVSHEYGSVAIHHFGHGGAAAPTMATRIAEALAPEAPFHEISFDRGGGEVLWQPPPGRALYVGNAGELLEGLRATAKDSRKVGAMRAALQATAKDSDRDIRSTASQLDEWLAKFPNAEVERVDMYANAKWHDPKIAKDIVKDFRPDMESLSQVLNELLFVLEHDLAPSVFMSAPCTWDSHAHNHFNQEVSMGLAMPALASFLGELDRRKSRSSGKPLSDETAVVVCSELGRFPLENSHAGKDHFPELPIMMFGPGLRSGGYGATGKMMEGLPISLADGRPQKTSQGIRPTVQDLGATLLEWFGVETPERAGRVLEFALDTVS